MEDCDERLYSKRKEGGRGLKSLKEVYDETKTRVACMLHVYSNKRMDNGSMEKQNPQGTDITEKISRKSNAATVAFDNIAPLNACIQTVFKVLRSKWMLRQNEKMSLLNRCP